MARTYDLLTFVTDYGTEGGFVGALHAVVDSIVPPSQRLRMIDLDHSIPAQDVLLGALRMERLTAYARPGVHVGVVDPGVGSSRLGVAVEAGGSIFVGPDNGLLMFAVDAAGGATRAVAIENYALAGRSKTFDGRDVFAPAAAHLASGVDLGELGPPIEVPSFVRLERPAPRELGGGALELLVVQVDGFGNVQFGASGAAIEGLGGAGTEVLLMRSEPPRSEGGTGPTSAIAAHIGSTFADVPPGDAVVLVDSDGCLALSVNRGRADKLLGVRPSDLVRCSPVAVL